MDELKKYISENRIITNREAEKLGFGRHNLSELARTGKLERLRPGVYQLNGEITDDFVLISSGSKRVVFSNLLANILHG